MKLPLLPLLLLVGGPALADGFPDQHIPDPGRLAPQAAAVKRPPTLAIAASFRDAEGQRYSAADVKLGFLPVPKGYRRSGGGLVRIWGGASAGWRTPGIDAPATISVLMGQGGGNGTPDTNDDGRGGSCERGNASFCPPQPPTPPTPPQPPQPPLPPDPPNTQNVPGPLGLGLLAAAFALSRKLRRRIRS